MSTTALTKPQPISPGRVWNTAKRESSLLLSKVGTTKLKELKIVSPSFSFPFDVTVSEGSAKKSVAKFIEVIYKHLAKSIPHQAYFIPVIQSKSAFQIPISISNEREGRVIRRYVRLIEYKCVLYGVPGYIEIEDLQEEDSVAKSTAESLVGTTPSSPSNVIRVLFYWGIQRPYMTSSGTNTRMRVAMYNFYRHVRSQESYLDDLDEDTTYKDLIPERIFFFLPYVLTTLTTISRKAAYDYRAFSIAGD